MRNFQGSPCTIERTGARGICTKIPDCALIYKIYLERRHTEKGNRPTVCSRPDKSVCCPAVPVATATTSRSGQRISAISEL